jgi:hypothetical protein
MIMLAIRAKTVLRETEGQETIFSPQKPFEVSLSDCLPCWQGSSSSRKIFFSGWVAVFSMGGQGAGTGIYFDHVVSKERVKSAEK